VSVLAIASILKGRTFEQPIMLGIDPAAPYGDITIEYNAPDYGGGTVIHSNGHSMLDVYKFVSRNIRAEPETIKFPGNLFNG